MKKLILALAILPAISNAYTISKPVECSAFARTTGYLRSFLGEKPATVQEFTPLSDIGSAYVAGIHHYENLLEQFKRTPELQAAIAQSEDESAADKAGAEKAALDRKVNDSRNVLTYSLGLVDVESALATAGVSTAMQNDTDQFASLSQFMKLPVKRGVDFRVDEVKVECE